MSGKWSTQSDSNGIITKVASDGYHHKTGQQIATEFIIQEKSGATGTKNHTHIGLDVNGNQIFRTDKTV